MLAGRPAQLPCCRQHGSSTQRPDRKSAASRTDLT